MISDTFLHNKTSAKRILALCLALVLSFSMLSTGVSAVSQQELDALKAKQSDLARQKSEVQAQASALQDELSEKNQQLDLLSQEIELTVEEIDTLNQLIASYTSAVAQMEDELARSRLEEEKAVEHFHTRMRAMEENGSVSYIAILFKASSFTDLLSRINCIEEISRHDNELIDNVRAAQKLVEENKAATEAQIAIQQEAVEEYQKKQDELLAQQAEVEAVLASLSADSAEYQQQLETIVSMQTTLSGQVSTMTTALEELKRLQAEQNAMQDINNSTGSDSTGGTGNTGGSTWYGDGTSTATGMDIVNYAQSFLGVPYVYGGTSPSGFDCSGLIYYCYTYYGYSVYRTAATLAYNGTAVSKDNLQAGDVILFTSSGGGYIGHCGIYVGGGQFIHAPHTGDVVKFSSLSDSYYSQHYYGARRIV